MKTKIFLTILYLSTLAGYILAQTPGFNYQAVLRDKEGAPMPNAQVTLFISLTDGPAGQVLYKESQNLTSNDLGMLNTTIGNGAVESGQFGDIIGVQNLNIKIEADLPGEPDIVDFGFTPLGATHFALYGEDDDADPKNEMQELSLEGDSLKISDGGSVSLEPFNSPWNSLPDGTGYSIDFTNARDGGNEVVVKRDSPNGGAAVAVKGENGSNQMSCSATKMESEDLKNSIEFLKFFVPNFTYPVLEGLEEKNTQGVVNEKSFNSRNQSSTNIVGTYEDVEKQQPILFEIDHKRFNENLEAAGLEEISEQEFREKFECKVVPARRSVGEWETKLEKGVNFNRGDVWTDLFYKGKAGLSYAVFPSSANGRQASTFGGTFSTANDNGPSTLSGAFPGTDPTNGFQIVFNGQNFGTVNTVNSELAGASTVFGANGLQNVTMSTFAGTPNHGMVAVYGDDGVTPRAYMRSTATVSEVAANLFTTLATPPARSDGTLAFTAPIGGEAAAYDRGTAQLVNGEATVICSEHFRWIADEASMTVTITPLSADSKGIAVIDKTNSGFKVKELLGGKGNYAFDYSVMCKRKGHENFQVERQATKVLEDQSQEILKHLPRGPMTSIRDLYKESN